MTVRHIAGAIGLGEVKGQDREIGFGTQLEDSIKCGAGDMVLCPKLEFSDLGQEVTWLRGVIHVPHPGQMGLMSYRRSDVGLLIIQAGTLLVGQHMFR